jgi:putative MATE family efflux protein
MKDENKTYLFEDMPVPSAVMKLAIPTVMSSLVMVFYNLADTWFVGLLNDPVQNAAVTLAAPILLAFNAVNNLFGVGSSAMMSRALGSHNYNTVYKSSAFGFYCSLICGVLFAVLYTLFKSSIFMLLGVTEETSTATGDYLFWTVSLGATPAILNVVFAYLVRAEGSSLHASLGTMSGCILNIILDPIFVLPWGFNMGAAGAGLATFISNCVACLYFFILLFIKRGRTYVCIKPSMFKPQRDILLGIFSVGVPASIQNLLNVTGMTVLNNFTAVYGSDAVAAMGIAQKINMVPMYIAMGISQGVMPLVGYNYASKNGKRMRDAITTTAKISVGMLVAVAVIYFCFSRSFIAMFIKNESIIDYGTVFLRYMCFSLPLLCTDFLAVGVFQACGMGKMSFIFAILRKIVLEIPLLFILNRLNPLYGLAMAQTLAELVLAIAATLSLMRIFKKQTGK